MAATKESQQFRELIKRGIDQERAIRLIQQARTGEVPEKRESLSERALREAGEFTTEPVVEEKISETTTETEDISGFDIGVKSGKALSGFGKEFKTEGVPFPETKNEIALALGTTLINIPGDTLEAVGEVVEMISDPIGTGGAIKTTATGFVEKGLNSIFSTNIGQSILESIGVSEGKRREVKEGGVFTEEENKLAADAAIQHLKDNFGTLDKASKTITENPVDSILFLKTMIGASKKVLSKNATDNINKLDKSLSERLKESAKKDVEQALGTQKEKFKQKGRNISEGIIERKIIGSRKQIQVLAKQKASDFSTQIKEFIDSGKLKGTIKRDDLLNVLDDIRKEGQVGDVILDESIVNAADKMADAISGFGKEIPAEKARVIRQMFDDAVYSTKGVIGEESLSLKNNIKRGLADSIRKQLAEQNPDLAKINKEFNFYKTLDEVLTETINRTGPQQGGLTSTIAGGGGLGAGAVIFGDVKGAIATALVVKGLSTAMKSPRWKLIKASTKSKLADALASGDKNLATKISSDIIKLVLQNKAKAFIGGQVTESNLELNK